VSKTKIPSFHGQEEAARSEAAKIMSSIMDKTSAKNISVVVECMVGNVRETIQHMVGLWLTAARVFFLQKKCFDKHGW
jgi:hypothetical protein